MHSEQINKIIPKEFEEALNCKVIVTVDSQYELYMVFYRGGIETEARLGYTCYRFKKKSFFIHKKGIKTIEVKDYEDYLGTFKQIFNSAT